MKQKLFILDFKKVLDKLFSVNRFKADTGVKSNIPVCPCQELTGLKGEMRLISEQLEKLNSCSCQTQEVNVENINLEKIVLESLSFNLGNIDVDTINGTMNIGITVNLPSSALMLPEKIKVSDNKTSKSDPTISSVKQTNEKKAVYHICINPNDSAQVITPKIIRTDYNEKVHSDNRET